MTGVYKILHLPTNSVYIGQTSRPFKTRWNEHKNQLNDGSHKNWKLRELWNISDELDFEFQEISRVPDIFTPLNAQIFRALEEIYSIKEHKANGFSVLNITDGETVSTKKAWAELIENYKSIESNRIRKLKKRHSDRTSRRRNLEELKVELQKLRWHIYHQYEFKIDKIQHVLNRKSIFYRLLGLVPSNKRQQTLNKEIEGLREKIRIRNDSHASLKDALAEHGYILNSSPTHWEVFDLYRKVKKNAYSLRNHHAELKGRDLPSNEIPLDLNCPTTSETSEAFEYLESFFPDSPFKKTETTPNLDRVQDCILTLYKARIFGRALGYLGLAILHQEGLFLNKDLDRAKKFFTKAVTSSIGDMSMEDYWKHELISLHENYLNNPMDLKTQITLLEELSSKGYAFAQYDLGMLYAEGAVVSKDLNTAFELYKKSAEWGHLFAMYELALMYLDGDPIPEDLNLAFKWMHDAAKEGVSDAAFTMGWMYESGSGCAVDHINAYTWYLIYSKSDFASDITEDLLRVSSLLSKEEIQKAEDNILSILN